MTIKTHLKILGTVWLLQLLALVVLLPKIVAAPSAFGWFAVAFCITVFLCSTRDLVKVWRETSSQKGLTTHSIQEPALPPPLPGLWLDPDTLVAHPLLAVMTEVETAHSVTHGKKVQVAKVSILTREPELAASLPHRNSAWVKEGEDLAATLARKAAYLMGTAESLLGKKWAFTPGIDTLLEQLEAVAKDPTQPDDVRKPALKLWMKLKLE